MDISHRVSTTSDLMIEDELRQTEIMATAFAKTEAVHQKQMNNLVLRIILDDDDDSSTDSSDTSTTADSTMDDGDFQETLHEDGDENNPEAFNRKRTMSDDDSSGSPLKRLRPCFDHNRSYKQLQDDYLGISPVYPKHYFQRRYGISLDRFNYILEKVSKQNHPFYKPNEMEPCIEAKLLLPLGALISGSPPDRTIDYFQMSEEMARECCDRFDEIVYDTFGCEYLRTPLASDLENIRKRHKAGPGMEKLFCTREGSVELWKECPANWRDQENTSNGPIILKGASDNQHWIWHAEFGVEDTVNNRRALSQSPLPEGINLGKSGRSGIKRAFYVLQSKFQFLQRMQNMKLSFNQVGNRIRTCILLHNMIISDKVMGGDVRARYDPNFQE